MKKTIGGKNKMEEYTQEKYWIAIFLSLAIGIFLGYVIFCRG